MRWEVVFRRKRFLRFEGENVDGELVFDEVIRAEQGSELPLGRRVLRKLPELLLKICPRKMFRGKRQNFFDRHLPPSLLFGDAREHPLPHGAVAHELGVLDERRRIDGLPRDLL